MDSRRSNQPNIYQKKFEVTTADNAEKNNIQDVINKLKATTITHRNAKEWYDAIKNRNSMVETSVSNLLNRLETVKTDLQNMLDYDKVKDMMENDKILPLEVFNLITEMYRALDEILIFRTLQITMTKLFVIKMFQTLQEVKALDIEREVTQGMREIQGEYMNIIKDIVSERDRMLNERIENLKTSQKQEMESFVTNVYTKIIKDFEKLNGANVLAIKELTTEFNNILSKRLDQLNLPNKEKLPEFKRSLAEVVNVSDELEHLITPIENKISKVHEEVPIPQIPATKSGELISEDIGILEDNEDIVKDFEIDEDDEGDEGDEGDEDSLATKEQPTSLLCPQCTRTFNNQAALDMHIKYAHGG
jgi:hypothetical protein